MANKNYQIKEFEKAASNLGAKDKEFVSVTEGGVPQTKPEEISSTVRKFYQPAVQAAAAIPQTLGNMLIPGGAPFGKDNPFVASQKDLDARAVQLANMKTYREKRDSVRDNVVNIIHTAKEKNPNWTPELAAELDQDINNYVRSMGLSSKDFITATPSSLLAEDEFGFYTSSPNPYPAIEYTQEAIAGTVGSLKGYRAGPVLKDAFGNFFRYGTKGTVDRMKAGWARSGTKNIKAPGPWWAKALGAVAGGAIGVGAADYGYEMELDILNRAGVAKKTLQMSDNQIKNLIGDMIPELATFGPTGINRPDQTERMKSAVKDMVIDAGVSSVFFGIRPAYYGLRNFIGEKGFRMFKPRAGSGVATGTDILSAEQRLYGSGKFSNFNKVDPETEKFVAATLGPRAEDITMHLPVIGKAVTRLMRSPVFNFLSPSELKMPLNKFEDMAPKLNTRTGTNVQRSDVGSPILAGGVKMFGRAPVIGGAIYKNKAQQMDAYMDLGESIIQKLTFAPLINITEHGVRVQNLANASARGFINAADLKQNALLDAARNYGAVVDDTNLVNMAKRIYEKGMSQRQIVPGDTRQYGGNAASSQIPKVTPEPILDFLKTQIIDPGVAGARTIEMYYGLRSQMDELYKKWMKNADGESQGDIMNLYKAWESDIGKLADSGIPEVAKLWRDYETFVSNGMLMFGTKAGKAMTGGIERTGMALNQIDPDRQASNLFQSVVDIAKADPANAAQTLAVMKNIVGDKAYYQGLGIYLNKVFNNSIRQVDGAELFDGQAFKEALGLGKDNPLGDLFKKALPGPQVSKLVKTNQRTGEVLEFDNVSFNEGLKKAGTVMPEGITGRQAAQLPTQSDLSDFATVMEAAAKNGIPQISTFMARRAVMGGIRSGIASAMPQSALGLRMKTGAAAGALGSFTGWVVPVGLAYAVRYMGGIMTSPPSLRAFTRMMDDTLPEQTRLANFVRLVRLRPEEWKEFDRELYEVENDQRYRETVGKNVAPVKESAQIFKEAISDIYEKGKGIAEDTMGTPGSSPINKALDRIQNPPAPESNFFADEADMSSLGSSILQNPNMNSAAAASLYEGNLDQALANQAAPRMAARGGLISLVS
tara:strand:- start:640 stop:3951 length:3312 start_codon:yes stop_codon:yes gene_type:complete